MGELRTRREVLGGVVVGGVAGALTASTANAQPVAGEIASGLGMTSINPDARALLPDGKLVDRAELLGELGLDPNTPVDAWLAIVACGSNASALTAEQLSPLVNQADVLERLSEGAGEITISPQAFEAFSTR